MTATNEEKNESDTDNLRAAAKWALEFCAELRSLRSALRMPTEHWFYALQRLTAMIPEGQRLWGLVGSKLDENESFLFWGKKYNCAHAALLAAAERVSSVGSSDDREVLRQRLQALEMPDPNFLAGHSQIDANNARRRLTKK